MTEEDELFEVAVYRQDALAALADSPLHRRELQEALGVSKTTCHRIVRTFDTQGLVQRTDEGYALTLFGQIVAAQAARFDDQLRTARRMRPLLEGFDVEDEPVNLELFTSEEVEWEVHADQSFSIDRGVDRVKDIELLRVLDWTPVPDLYHEKILQLLADNQTKTESIYPTSEIKQRLERFPDLHDELLEAGGRARYWVYDDVPRWGLSIYDDAVVELRAYDRQSGAYLMDAVSESTAVVDWAVDLFLDYRDRSAPLSERDDLPDWGDYSW